MQYELTVKLRSSELLGFGYDAAVGASDARVLIPPEAWSGRPDWKEMTIEGVGRKFLSVRIVKPRPMLNGDQALEIALAAIICLGKSTRHGEKIQTCCGALCAASVRRASPIRKPYHSVLGLSDANFDDQAILSLGSKRGRAGRRPS
jgi:hypothetical protein